jgi:fumarate reductase flavoprotein subunit
MDNEIYITLASNFLGGVCMRRSLKKIVAVLTILTLAFALVGCVQQPAPQTTTEAPTTVAPTTSVPEDDGLRTDVVVVGAGAAGIAAAIEASREGARVILLEKMPFVGGSTLLSGGIVLATNSPIQQDQGIEDSAEALAQYWLDRAEGNADMDLLTFIAEKSGETIAWLMENGVEFSDNVSAGGTSPVLRLHYTKADRGFGLIKPLEEIARNEGVQIMLQTTAKKLLLNNANEVTGLIAIDKDGKEIQIDARAVVLATGGFDRSEEMKDQYAPVASGHISYSNAGNIGEGFLMAQEAGAEMIYKDGVIGFRGLDGGVPYTSAIGGLIWQPHLYVDSEGNRFTNEVIDYPIFYKNMVENGSDVFYLLFDQTKYVEALEEAIERGFAFKASTWEELALLTGMNEDVLIQTVSRYNDLAESGEDADFGKPAALMNPLTEADFYAVAVRPATLGTYGGPRINADTEVLRPDGSAIFGLFAAGEVANGQFFYKDYPASGTSIQMCFTLGRVAGKSAVAHALLYGCIGHDH